MRLLLARAEATAALGGGATLAFTDATHYRYTLACILDLAGESREAVTLLQQALTDQATLEATQRASIQRVLASDDAKRLAGEMGLNLADASTAVSTLSGSQLAQAAHQAAAAEVAIAGGATVVAISLTTLLLVLIIVILLAQ